jgi:hypothetical protein
MSFRSLQITDLVARELRFKLCAVMSPGFTFSGEDAIAEHDMEIVAALGPEVEVVEFGREDGLDVGWGGGRYHVAVEEVVDAVGVASHLVVTGEDYVVEEVEVWGC